MTGQVALDRELRKNKKKYFTECQIGGTRQRGDLTPPAHRTITLTHSLFTVSPQPPQLWSAFPLPLPLSRRPRARGIGHGGPPASSRKLPAPAAVLSCCRYRPTCRPRRLRILYSSGHTAALRSKHQLLMAVDLLLQPTACQIGGERWGAGGF